LFLLFHLSDKKLVAMASRRKTKEKRSTSQKKKTNSYPPSTSEPATKKAKNNPEKNLEKQKPSKRKPKSIESSSSNVLIDNIMPVKNSSPVLLPTSEVPPLKKNKTNRTLYFLSRIAERVFKEKFENMLDKLLQKRSS
jgi:hypothetical protein